MNKNEHVHHRFHLGLRYVAAISLAFLVLALFAYLFPHATIDLTLTRTIQSIHFVWFDKLMWVLSWLGYAPQLYIELLIIIGAIYFFGLKREAIIGAVDVVGIGAISKILKIIIHRPRPTPDLVKVATQLKDFSFPSTHVVIYTAFLGYLAFLIFIHWKNSAKKIIALVVLSLMIILIGPSRVYLGAHWSSDVLGAYFLANLWLLGIIYFYHKLLKK